MENHSFEEEISGGNPSGDPNSTPTDSLETEPQADPPGTSRNQPKESEPIYSVIKDDDHESPPAYVQRHMPQEQKLEDLQELEPPPEPVQESYDVRLDPELQQQARNRRARRSRQLLVEGPCSLRPNSPNVPPLPEPEAYPDPDQQQDQEPAISPIPITCSERFHEIYRRVCLFSFQFPFHTLLLTWPLATAIMGVLNLTFCPINLLLPYVMMAVGILGAATIVLRLCMLYFENRLTAIIGEDSTDSYWIGVRVAELIIWVFFVTQLFYFFHQAPNFTPGGKNYCKPKYYKINCGLMFLTSVTMFGWMIVYVSKLVLYFQRRNVPHRT